MTKTSWYRPFNAILFVPATPNGELQKSIQKIVTEEAARLNLTAKVVESGGVSLKQQLVKTDLTGCFYPDCYLCESDSKGGSHTKSGVHYSGVCVLCAENGTISRYDGESGRSGYWRATKFHKKDILTNRGVFIKNSEADHVLNSKAEHHQPALRHVTTTRENRHGS